MNKLSQQKNQNDGRILFPAISGSLAGSMAAASGATADAMPEMVYKASIAALEKDKRNIIKEHGRMEYNRILKELEKKKPAPISTKTRRLRGLGRFASVGLPVAGLASYLQNRVLDNQKKLNLNKTASILHKGEDMNARQYLINRMEKTASMEYRNILAMSKRGPAYKKIRDMMIQKRKAALKGGTAKSTMPDAQVLSPKALSKRQYGLMVEQGRLRGKDPLRHTQSPGTLRQLSSVSPSASPLRKRLSTSYRI